MPFSLQNLTDNFRSNFFRSLGAWRSKNGFTLPILLFLLRGMKEQGPYFAVCHFHNDIDALCCEILFFGYSFPRSLDVDENDCDHAVGFYRFRRAFSLRRKLRAEVLAKMAEIAFFIDHRLCFIYIAFWTVCNGGLYLNSIMLTMLLFPLSSLCIMIACLYDAFDIKPGLVKVQ